MSNSYNKLTNYIPNCLYDFDRTVIFVLKVTQILRQLVIKSMKKVKIKNIVITEKMNEIWVNIEFM